MKPIRRLLLPGVLVLLVATVEARDGEGLPPGFVAEPVVGGWNQPLDLAFLPDGRLLVAEKAGLVWMVDAGVKSSEPIIDLTEEVGDAGSRGLKSIAVDPAFASNGLVYLFYDVDRHHLFFFGTPQYDPLVTDNSGPTIARIARAALNPADNFTSLVPGSRTVLVGESASTGFPLVNGHQSGMLRFGEDGSLLASCGDGAPVAPDFGGGPDNALALAEGILSRIEDVGAFRAQLVDSLSGKLVRLDPSNGDGIVNNPFFDPAAPRSARSRVWATGFRNPFRFEVMPGSATAPELPGTLLVGDVGRSNWEELSRVTAAGQNFGWPLFEGLQKLPDFWAVPVENLSAPNPLFGQTIPGMGLCTQPFFHFQELLVQASLNPPAWQNPCDPLQQIPAAALPRMHTRPDIDWNHVGPARSGDFDLAGKAIVHRLDDPKSLIAGTVFQGACAMGGVWYESGGYPSGFDKSFLFSDFTDNWIKSLRFDGAGVPYEVGEVAAAIGEVVAMATDPLSGDVYYLQLVTLPMLPGVLNHLAYYPGNVPPSASAERTPAFGPSHLSVQFDAGGSSDPEGAALTFAWDFGDGTPLSKLEAPVHVFPSKDVTPQGTIVAQVLELVPPQVIDQTAGLFPAVIQDGSFIKPSAPTAGEQYMTIYQGVDSDPEDWVGYTFAQPHSFHQVVFQEGSEVGSEGGWFQSLTVDVRVGGVWTEVTGLGISPPYGGQDGVFYETFELRFDPLQGDGIRIRGLAGGSGGFVSIGELRAISLPPPTGLPTRYDITLVVRDDVSLTSQTETSIWIDNTPPSVAITSPLNGGTYDPTKLEQVLLTAVGADLESAPSSLTCTWQVSQHHNDHAHPEPLIQACTASIDLPPHVLSSDNYFWEFALTVTDPEGLSATSTSLLWPTPPSLVADTYTLSLLEGGSSELSLAAGPARAGHFYMLLMSASGSFPGKDVSGIHIPLNSDPLLVLTSTGPPVGALAGFHGVLGAVGEARVDFVVPPATYLSYAGTTLNFAFVTSSGTGTVEFASNPVPVLLDH